MFRTSSCGFLVLLLLAVWGRLAAGSPTREDEVEVFLENMLPLTVLSTIPRGLFPTREQDGSVEVSSRQALTVLFSRPVISLLDRTGISKEIFDFDPPVSGNTSWPSTYIAQFVPHQNWPIDCEVKVIWKEDVDSFDGVPLKFAARKPIIVQLTTPKLSVKIARIESWKSKRLTRDLWDSHLGMSEDILPEMPPDGRMFLAFNHPVSLVALEQHLQIYEDYLLETKVDLGLRVNACESVKEVAVPLGCGNQQNCETCTRNESSCAIVVFSRPPERNTRYFLVMKPGAEYSGGAGPLRNLLNVTFGGLRPFRIPFVDVIEQEAFTVRSRSLTMWLPHGLSKETTTKQLRSAISITSNNTGEEVDYEMRDAKFFLHLKADLRPDEVYVIEGRASSNVLDGYGQELQHTYLNLTTQALDAEFETWAPRSQKVSIFESAREWGHEVMAMYRGDPWSNTKFFCDAPPNVSVWQLNDRFELEALAALQSGSSQQSFVDLLEANGKKAPPVSELTLEEDPEGTEYGGVVVKDIASRIQKSGVVVTEYCSSQRYVSHVIVETNLQAAILTWGNGDGSAWIINMTTGKPVENAGVRMYRTLAAGIQLQLLGSDQIERVFRGKSDIEGIVHLENVTTGLNVAVEHEKKLLFVPDVVLAPMKERKLQDVIILDRNVVKPGESLSIIGYVFREESGYLQPAGLSLPVLSINPPLDATTGSKLKLTDWSKLGSFHAFLKIPADAKPAQYTVQLEAPEFLGSFARFTIMNPWPVLPLLEAQAPFWVTTDANVSISVTVRSSTDVPISMAKVNVSCIIKGPSGESLEQEHVVVTNAQGTASSVLDLSTLGDRDLAGSLLISKIAWIGPSHTFVEQSTVTRLELADLTMTLERSVDTDLPGQPFGVRVIATDLKGNPLSGTADVALLRTSSPWSPVSSSPLKGKIFKSCSVEAGSKVDFSCRMKLPSTGNFVLEVCMKRKQRKRAQARVVCRRESLGYTRKEWLSKPRDSHMKLGLVTYSDEPYEVPGDIEFGLENPYSNCMALLTWGNSLGFNQTAIQLDDNSLHRFNITIGEGECLGDCALAIVVSVPRQDRTSLRPRYRVPTSKLFDPFMPHFDLLKKSIKVDQQQSMPLEMKFIRRKQNDVAKPGEKVRLELKLPKHWENFTEAKLVVVKKAAESIMRTESQGLGSMFSLDLAAEFTATTSSELLIAPQTGSVLKDTYRERLREDPWTPILSDEFGANVESRTVDVVGKEYRSLLRKPITVIPRLQTLSPGAGHSSGDASDSELSNKLMEMSGGHTSSLILDRNLFPVPHMDNMTGNSDTMMFDFVLPDDPGTYSVRAYVTTVEEIDREGLTRLRLASRELQLDVQRSFALSVTTPRFVRLGDRFDAMVDIVQLMLSFIHSRDASKSAMVSIKAGSKLKIIGKKNKNVILGHNHSSTLAFRVQAKKIGKVHLEVTVVGIDGNSQKQRVMIQVLESQDAVRYMKNSIIKAGETSNLLPIRTNLPSSNSGSGKLDIHMGLGGLPTFLSFLHELYIRRQEQHCPALVEVSFSTALLYTIGLDYGIRDMNPSKLKNGTIEAVSSLLNDADLTLRVLESMTSESLGLDLVAPCPDAPPEPISTSARIQWSGRAVALVRLLGLLQTKGSLEELKVTYNKLQALSDVWRIALERMILSMPKGSHNILCAGAAASAGLGHGWNESDSTVKTIDEFVILDVESQAYTLLAYLPLKDGERPSDALFERGIKHWIKSFQRGDSLTYLPSTENPATPASYLGNALALLTLLAAKQKPVPGIEGLVRYVASPSVGSGGLKEISDLDRTVAMLALRLYDMDNPVINGTDITGTVTHGSDSDKGEFRSASDPIVHISKSMDGIDSPNPLEVSTKGSGKVTVAALLTIVPSVPHPNPLFQGIFIERSIHAFGCDTQIGVVPCGSVVIIRMQLTVPVDLPGTNVRILMPGGLEAMDPTEGGEFSGACIGKGLDLDDQACPKQNIESSTVTFSFESLRRGAHSIHFHAVASYTGEFFFPPVKAFVRSRPIHIGFTGSATFVVCSKSTRGCDFVERNQTSIPKKCLHDCSHNGACDLRTGKCFCRQGFNGSGCNEFDAR